MESRKRNIPMFNGEKYGNWKTRIRSLLDELNILKVIDQNPEANQDWSLEDKKAKNTILDFLDDSFLKLYREATTAKDLFAKLDATYERKSCCQQNSARKQLFKLRFKEDTSLHNHFMIFEDLINTLVSSGGQVDELNKITMLLCTLPQSYDGVVTSIETILNDNSNFADIKSRLIDHEIKLKNESNDTSAKVLLVNEPSVSVPQQNNKPTGFKKKFTKAPNDNQPKNMGLSNNNNFKPGKKRCYYCKKEGHIMRNCYTLKNLEKASNYNNEKAAQVTQQVPESHAGGIIFMAGREMQLDASQADKNKINFILDSGATDHLINDASLFQEFVYLNPPVQLRVAKSNTFIKATKRGIIQVTTNMGYEAMVENVLFCPDVPYNVLSVQRLQKAGIETTFDQAGGVKITKNGKMVIIGEQLADALTKSLTAVKFSSLRANMGLE